MVSKVPGCTLFSCLSKSFHNALCALYVSSVKCLLYRLLIPNLFSDASQCANMVLLLSFACYNVSANYSAANLSNGIFLLCNLDNSIKKLNTKPLCATSTGNIEVHASALLVQLN